MALCSSVYVAWSRSWSPTCTASRSCRESVGNPRGTAHDFSTPSSSSLRSKCGAGFRWSCSTNASRTCDASSHIQDYPAAAIASYVARSKATRRASETDVGVERRVETAAAMASDLGHP